MRYGGNPGRGSHSLSLAAAQKVFECRELAAELFGVSEPERVFFTMNTTHGLNTVIKGLLRDGDHVIISDMEHNAVYRPLFKLAEQGRVEFDTFSSMTADPRKSDMLICANIARRMRPNTRMVVCTHISNICSAMLPIQRIGEFCHRYGLLFVVDGAQSAGHERISVDEMNIDALCVPGHKGLYGPQGCGMVILGRGVCPETLCEGGNGVNSLEGSMPELSPERYEAGTLPTAAIAGLCEGIRAVQNIGVERIGEYERMLLCGARERLEAIPRLRIYVPEDEGATLLFNIDGIPSETVCSALDAQGICVRGGYHCTALGHRTLGTPEGGAVRISFGIYNTVSELDALYRALLNIGV